MAVACRVWHCLLAQLQHCLHSHSVPAAPATEALPARPAAPPTAKTRPLLCFAVQVALATASILPSDSDVYVTRKVSRAVEDAFGVAPLLVCWHGQLLEVRLCVGLDLKVSWLVHSLGAAGCWALPAVVGWLRCCWFHQLFDVDAWGWT